MLLYSVGTQAQTLVYSITIYANFNIILTNITAFFKRITWLIAPHSYFIATMWASDDIVLIMAVGEVILVAIATEIIHKDGAVSIREEGPGERPSDYGKKRKRRDQNEREIIKAWLLLLLITSSFKIILFKNFFLILQQSLKYYT